MYRTKPPRDPRELLKRIRGHSKPELLAALFELSWRVQENTAARARVQTPADAFAVVRDYAAKKQEHLIGLYLDSQNYLLAREVISIGSLNTTRSHPREILRPAIVHQALGFLLVHNHPSGTLVPSSDDVEFTRAVSKAADLLGIPLYDHIVISREGFASLKEKGML